MAEARIESGSPEQHDLCLNHKIILSLPDFICPFTAHLPTLDTNETGILQTTASFITIPSFILRVWSILFTKQGGGPVEKLFDHAVQNCTIMHVLKGEELRSHW